MLRNIADTYFKDDNLDALNKTLMVFAFVQEAYSTIGLHASEKMAASQGLNPNLWFKIPNSVVAKGVGQETVQYVSNIYKHMSPTNSH